ncbi:uncharacterized protein EDB93DRAFT_1093671 [Suillus bovinus]|uniref:uncharacterized protein n=1 Tax=Suillus bovinus TaxID=48563 RepID=UPI001B867673|nr:uncharacterized protein EDB93DRAFT_1093671 [Suillus bovinus]KAG2132716.1 hypothetical protein EDB93DRAFT_1093671 [Suillus bovinus]
MRFSRSSYRLDSATSLRQAPPPQTQHQHGRRPAHTIWIQTIAYASLTMSLLAAFGAVLGKQWLGYYKTNRYGRGSQEERAKHRQEKFEGLVTWYFDAVVQSFPVLLQISLLLFGIALGSNLWYEQPSIAWVIIAATAFGFLFYSLTVMACLISPPCPFQTPISRILCILRIDSRNIFFSEFWWSFPF